LVIEPEIALELRGVSKTFGSVRAVEGIDFAASRGQIHAIVGDNGAGKSTMIKIVVGIYPRDCGSVRVQGVEQPMHFDVASSRRQGVAVVYQDLALVECLDISANMALGNLPRRWGFVLDRRKMDQEASKVLTDLNVRVGDVSTPVGLLSGGQRQVVAIARAVRTNSPILLLDEPTAALGVRESAQVGGIIDEIRDKGTAVILVSHDLEFVFHHADIVTVLRLGKVVGTRRIAEVDRDEIVAMITGLRSDPQEGPPSSSRASEGGLSQ